MSEPNDTPTISRFFTDTVEARRDKPALGFIRGGEIRWRTWQDVYDDAAATAARIQAAGVRPGQCVAHVSENRYEWIITDLAMHLAGVVHVPIHVTLSGEQIAEQIVDCGARMVFVSSGELLGKFSNRIDSALPVVIYDMAKPQANAKVDWQESSPDSLATILYTSGTTGRSRGVMLSHRNLATNAAATCELFNTGPEITRLNILPLSHIYARTCDLYTWVYRGYRLVLGENRDTLARDCQLARPNALNAVPFVYQRIAERIRAPGVADEAAALREFFGGQMQWLTSGGAPLAADVERWYAEHGLRVFAGYGLTESSPVISMSMPTSYRYGCVGRVLPDVEVRIAEDGEILCRGPNVMLGYWHNSDATNDAIRDGWLHTGDLGEVDSQGFLSICGRKKELIVLSTGKKVVPTRVEALLTASPLIEQAAVFGDGQCGLVALIVPGAVTMNTRELIEAEIARCLASAAHEEQIHRFVLADRPFSIERGELTPKMSLCRTVIARNFAAQLSSIAN